jgi:hypothetical protein
MKKVFVILSIASFLYACGGGNPPSSTSTTTEPNPNVSANAEGNANPNYDPKRGEGKFSSENVTLGASLDMKMAKLGEKVQSVKCSPCHKLTEEKLVGPGWKGVTERRRPEWIMNFITNPDPMIDKDPQVQAALELCLVRMPNQNLSDDEARNVVEYMRKNDGVK